jgi:RecB family endonuclease NucS
MKESDLESIFAKYPDLIEDGLILKGRQVTVYGRRMDLLFDDKHKRQVIVELKAGPIKDEHIGQILSYEGMLLSADNPDIRVKLVGTRIPPNIEKALDHHGIGRKEIKLAAIKEFLADKGDHQFDHLFEDGSR